MYIIYYGRGGRVLYKILQCFFTYRNCFGKCWRLFSVKWILEWKRKCILLWSKIQQRLEKTAMFLPSGVLMFLHILFAATSCCNVRFALFFVLNFEESCFVGFCKLLSIIFSKIIFSCCSFSIVCFLLRNRSFASSNICEIKKAKQDLIVARCVWAGKCAKLSHTSFPVVCAFGFGFSMTQVPYKQKQTTFNNVFDPG